MPDVMSPLHFTRGKALPNRFLLAPLTNSQSHEDGTLSEEELHWLTMRATGSFGMVMTCAAQIHPLGKGFPGQLGAFDDMHIPGLTRIADQIRAAGSVSSVQLHHAGMRSPAKIIGEAPLCPSDNEEFGARALSHDEVTRTRDDFIAAAVRCDQAGLDGVELHGAHGYLLCQFFSDEINLRDDEYGGSLENRYRLLFEIIDGVRSACRPDFTLGVRLSPERFGIRMSEAMEMAATLMQGGKIDYLDMSLWDCFKEPEEEAFKGKSLLAHFAELERGETRLGAAGNLRDPESVARAMAGGLDWVMLGRAAILHHDFPQRYAANPQFETVALPVTRNYLKDEGLSPSFIEYMDRWPGFVSEEAAG